MVNYQDVENFIVPKEHQPWIKKKWQQNLSRYHMEGDMEFDKDGFIIFIIRKPKLNKIYNLFERFLRKLHQAGKDKKGSVIYLLKDGTLISAEYVLPTEDYHKISAFLKTDL